jgi:hypothetical protein
MKLLELALKYVKDKTIVEGTVDFLSDIISTLNGDAFAGGKLVYTFINGTVFIREQLFWIKFEMFLNGIDISDDGRANFCKMLTEDGMKKENPYRLTQIIDRVDTLSKIDYLINASRCLSIGFIKLPVYFRLCHIINNSLLEDLHYLAEHILEDDEYEYSTEIQALTSNGLVYQSVIDVNNQDRYKFTSLAKDLDRFAISYNNIERYPNPVKKDETSNQDTRTVKVITRWG